MGIINSKIKAEEINNGILKILIAPFGQDGRVSEIDKIVAKNAAVFMLDFVIDELDWNDGKRDLLQNIKKELCDGKF